MLIIVYIDVIIIVNTIINYIILITTAKICDTRISRLKIVLGAILGGIYSALALLNGHGFIESPVIKVVAGILIVLIAFGQERQLVKIIVVFFSVSAMFAGAVLAVSYMSRKYTTNWLYQPVGLKTLLLSFAISYLIVSFVYRRAWRNLSGGGISEIYTELNGNKAQFKALHDTGNSLSEPLSGNRVIITDMNTVKDLFSQEIVNIMTDDMLRKPIQAAEELYIKDKRYKFRLVPYRAVGVNGGFLLAVKPDKLYVDKNQRKDILIALSPNKVSGGENYSALMGGERI